ncbi:ATP-dependent Clp protease proteolytic subunit 4, chloroplastic-like [Actinidia eriantha]|uniref:ATP-dependent Clp protease proteolytic subunit 4, chloroplastic-like n=1 Tax=Actinidia eriantha TaxID=165200 RepID=UPI00258662AD|nr:ATP-dependent Clp protease proteolytic subunit 4, chloroplastic-like [Actinidia eriantha]
MASLSLSPPLSANSLSSSHSRSNPLSITPNFSLRPSSLKSSKFSNKSKTLAPHTSLHTAASQEPVRAMRGGSGGGEGDVMGLLLRERIIFLGNDIDDFVGDAIISMLLLLDAQDPSKDIKMFINSSNGSLSATMGIYDVVQLVRADVSTIALGCSASTASIILGAGTKGKRFAMPNARIMIHQPSGGVSGGAAYVEVQSEELLKNKNNVARIISGFTGRTFEQVLKDIDRDRFMSPIEAVEYGIIDGVIDRETIIPLEPLPQKVKPRFNYEQMDKEGEKFLLEDIPDDEIY